MRFNTLLFIIAFFAVVFAFKTNKDYHSTKIEKESLKHKYDSLFGEYTLIKDENLLLSTAIETLEKEDPTITGRFDLLINGIVSKEGRSLKNRGQEDDDDLELVGNGVNR